MDLNWWNMMNDQNKMIFQFAMLNNQRVYWTIFTKIGLKTNAGHLYVSNQPPKMQADRSKIGNEFDMIQASTGDLKWTFF